MLLKTSNNQLTKSALKEENRERYMHPPLKKRIKSAFINPVFGPLMLGTLGGASIGEGLGYLLPNEYAYLRPLVTVGTSSVGMALAANKVCNRVRAMREKAARTREANKLKRLLCEKT